MKRRPAGRIELTINARKIKKLNAYCIENIRIDGIISIPSSIDFNIYKCEDYAESRLIAFVLENDKALYVDLNESKIGLDKRFMDNVFTEEEFSILISMLKSVVFRFNSLRDFLESQDSITYNIA